MWVKMPEVQLQLKLTLSQRKLLAALKGIPQKHKLRLNETSREAAAIEFTTSELLELKISLEVAIRISADPTRKQLQALLKKADTLLNKIKKDLKTTGSTKFAPAEVYQFKITLQQFKPEIWRRIQIADGTLGDLHDAIQIAMGWNNCHLHHFVVGEDYYGTVFNDGLGGPETIDERSVRISDLFGMKDKLRVCQYEYDFGDGWQHKIALEKQLPGVAGQHYPVCLEGENACPPEDIGGVWGYADFLEAIKNPKHERYKEYRGWIGGRFDPAKFNHAGVNKILKKMQ